MREDFDKTIRIPVVTDLVRGGDAEIVEQVKNPHARQQRRQVFEQRLKERIDELKSATGQDEYSGLARAHAIRSEGNQQITTQSQPSCLDPTVEKRIDKARDDLIRELAGMLPP